MSQSEADGNDVEGRQKRGVLELYSMVKCATGCDPLLYKGYGCYCGFLGRGRALDGIDRYFYFDLFFIYHFITIFFLCLQVLQDA